MNRFSKRSYEQELMDLPIDNKQELFLNLKELTNINKLTGGPWVTFRFLKHLLRNETREIHIADIGFGAGDMLQYILDHRNELNCPVKLTAIDIMPEAFEFATSNYPALKDEVTFICSDYKTWFDQGNKTDVVIAGLFCHHLNDAQMSEFLKCIKSGTTIGCIINDLHRSPVAYYGIKLLNKLFSKSRFTKNDAPLSVLRGFKRKELETFMAANGITHYKINWRWAFRYLVSISNNS